MKIYCFTCKKKQEAKDLSQGKDKLGKLRIQGKCSVCGGNVGIYGKLLGTPKVVKTPREVVAVRAPEVAEQATPVLSASGPLTQLNSMVPGDIFEIGGSFFILNSFDKGNVSANRVTPVPGGFTELEEITMGVVTLARRTGNRLPRK